ncbi:MULTISPECIES: flagellin [unclassified Burkholderia]|uniref:flagellin N-terminal helical domain-containing protein n=1 Tax=unclassified Burkholderia TaxID=2613784 RepID=UPI000F588C75|nr:MULTISPECIES: flagellin [unclassified Burkholderia]RQR43825.1 flagellin [Burkholderia sp. Bp9131]RQR75792.1 flagellin [Burkholderia sp. Bp9015]RQR97367.1 flagellin [Burkholderia sp. Bp8994]RQS32298.1 flagellin [Burkholderia sp. Bp8995]RQS39449.1 flagellin [Burkholderia sp. Bp8990]
MLNINTNLYSQTAQTNLSNTQNALSQAINRLSSGKRINSAADDAAGLAISTTMTASINAYNQGVANANNAVSMAQTASSGLSAITANLQRIRQLAVQASDDSIGSAAANNLDTEVQARITEIGRITSQTTFNGINLLDGTANAGAVLNFQIGEKSGQQLSLDLTGKYDTATLGLTGNVKTYAAAQTMMDTVDTALTTINTAQAQLGSDINIYQAAISQTTAQSTNLNAASAQITDANFAQETANLSKAQVLQQAGISVLAQANSMPQQVLKLLQ